MYKKAKKAPFFSALPKQRGLLPAVWGDVNELTEGTAAVSGCHVSD